jgi:hypothetical protein
MNQTLRTAALLSLLSCSAAFAQCTKDTDCKGERVCERGICTAPATTPLPSKRAELANAVVVPQPTADYPKFEDFPATKHPGPWVLPKGVRRVSTNEWRNENGKLIDPPKVNFAGKYTMILNSCGTGCRYYTLTDLSTGRDLTTLSVFAAAEPPPTTKEGFTYVTDLVGRASSNMLVAQYQVETKTAGTECRERVFVFESEKLRPVTNTKKGCTSF